MNWRTLREVLISPAALLALAIVVFVCNSYPMMRPGFDMWWHLGMTEQPQLANPGVFPAHRIYWHHFWHHVLGTLGLTDLFERALFIHRIQLFVTIALLSLSGYLSLRAILHKTSFPRQDIWLAALLSVIVWLLMNGTASAARGGGPGAFAVQSWVMWYSLNYQISLPFYFAAISCILYALTAAQDPVAKFFAALMGCLFITVGTLAHAAETAYFLICLGFLTLIFLRGKYALWTAAAIVTIGVTALWAALQQSYAKPPLIDLLLSSNWKALGTQIDQLGASLVHGKLNRSITGWTTIHSLSLIAIFLSPVLVKLRENNLPSNQVLDLRALFFVAMTALMPLALLFTYSAGILAMTTHLYIAWRFSLASFLFVGFSLLAIVAVQRLKIPSHMPRQIAMSAIVMIILTATLIYSKEFERFQPSYQNLKSLYKSTDKQDTYFGLSKDKRKKLSDLAENLRNSESPPILCTDLFTAYYLFFVERYHHVVMPEAMQYIPGYEPDTSGCKFGLSPESIR